MQPTNAYRKKIKKLKQYVRAAPLWKWIQVVAGIIKLLLWVKSQL